MSNQVGTEQCWAKSEIGKNRKEINRMMLVTTRCVTRASMTMYALMFLVCSMHEQTKNKQCNKGLYM